VKRYRILSFDFDSRVHSLEPVQETWEDNIKEQHIENKKKVIEGLKAQYGEWNLEQKILNFIDLKAKPFSVAAFHNKFLNQIRDAYVIESYYPALTGACALGERILNHMMIALRDYHKETPGYKKVYRKDSFDYWPIAIDALEGWQELLPEAADKFRRLNERRNKAIHFRPEIDRDDKEQSLAAIHLMQDIVGIQFSAFGGQPWFFCVPGEMYIKKEWEGKPLIKHIFIPNSLLVGPKHRVEKLFPKILVNDNFEYESREITDEEFYQLRQKS
jgi:hypothetical protein